jgi:tyrosine-protein phosphatase YwqE
MKRTDLHFHILPGLDDGPADLSGALELAADAADDGTEAVVERDRRRRLAVSRPRRLLEAGIRNRPVMRAA